MNRAITSAPPPGPAGMINSTGFWGSQAATLPEYTSNIVSILMIGAVQSHCFMWCSFSAIFAAALNPFGKFSLLIPHIEQVQNQKKSFTFR
jgi:hypothetical protein